MSVATKRKPDRQRRIVRRKFHRAQPRNQWYEVYEHQLNQRLIRLAEIAAIVIGKAWSHKQLAERSGVSESTIRRLFDRETQTPSDSTLWRIPKAQNALLTFETAPRASARRR